MPEAWLPKIPSKPVLYYCYNLPKARKHNWSILSDSSKCILMSVRPGFNNSINNITITRLPGAVPQLF